MSNSNPADNGHPVVPAADVVAPMTDPIKEASSWRPMSPTTGEMQRRQRYRVGSLVV